MGQKILSFNTPDGLPQPFVYCLQNDSLGKLWIGTGNGLASFNGKTLREEKTPFDASNRFISAATKDLNNRIWFGHFVGNISTRTTTGWKLLESVSSTKVIKLIDSFEGMFVVHQDAVGMLKNDSVQLLHKRKGNDLIFNDAAIYNSQLFLATNQGLWRYFNHSFERVAFADTSITAISIVQSKLYVGTNKGEVYQWQMQETPKLSFECASSITSLDAISNEIWVSTKNGTYRTTKDWKFIEHLITEEHITKVTEDFAGNIWISTYGSGLFQLSNEQFILLEDTIEKVIPHPVSGYFATNQNKIYHIKKQQEKWQSSILTELDNNTRITSMFLQDQKLFVGTELDGIQIIDLKDTSLISFEYNNFLENKKIHDFTIDKNGTWWVSVSLSGVLSYNPGTSDLNFYDTSTGLTHNDIYHLLVDNNNQVWMVSKGSGISVLSDNTFSYYSFNEGLSDLNITGITLGENNKVVVSTSGGGICLLQDNLFKSVTYNDGLPSNFVQSIAHIENDRYWVTTPDGVGIFDAKDISFKEFSKKHLKTNLVFTEKDIAVDQTKNCASFITNQGLFLYEVRDAKKPNKFLNIAITKVTAADSSFNFRNKITIPFKRQNVIISTELVSFGQSTPIGLEYQLYSSDTSWIGPVFQDQLIFSGLKDDNYQVVVRIANKPETAKKISLTILKPFWKTWWFVLICVLLLIFVIYLIFKIRLYRLKQYNRSLEQKVAQRTKQLSNRNRQLEQFTYTISHDLKNPAINLMELIKILEPNMQNHVDLPIFNMLDKTAGNMYNTLIELLNVLKATQEKGLKMETLSIKETIDDTLTSIGHSIEKSKASINIDLQQETLTFHKPHFQSIVYNLISNAIKYAKPEVPPVIEIKSFKETKYYCLQISDNGLGVDMEQDGQKLFGMFQRLHDHVEGTGVGLHLIHSIVQHAGGKIKVNSKVGVGSTFTVYLPKHPMENAA